MHYTIIMTIENEGHPTYWHLLYRWPNINHNFINKRQMNAGIRNNNNFFNIFKVR